MALSKEFFDDLISDTKFVTANSGSLMGSRMKIKTPLLAINCIYGGGIPLSVITRISGHPGGGKSTFSYQCMANYQRDFENGVPVIYDMEASMDSSRLETLGVDTDSVLRLPATSLDEAFESMFAMFNKLKECYKKDSSISTFQIFDTISTGGTAKQHEATSKGESAFGAGPMMESNRIIKQNLINVFPYIEELPICLGLLEQVFTQPGQYATTVAESKNYGLAHACHAHISFGQAKDEVDKNGFIIGTSSFVTLKKSKLSPKFTNIPCYIDVTQGGKIDEIESFLRYISSDALSIIKATSWWSMADTIEKMSNDYAGISNEIQAFSKSYRKNDFIDMVKSEPDLVNLLQVRLIDSVTERYPGQKDVTEDYKRELIKNCKYFSNCNIE